MELAILVIALVGTVILVARLAEPTRLPSPLALLVVGVAISFIPGVPTISLSPELVLVGLLPPLLYAAAMQTSLIDVAANRVAIISLSFGLVLFTAAGVALVAMALLPITFPLAFALGAIVAPPDAVAATAVARRIGLPRRVTTILEGESLLNDATALVSMRTALAAAGLAGHVASGTSVGEVTWSFVWAVVGGVGIGFGVFLLVGACRRLLDSAPMDTALSFLVPFVAYVPAEELHASGVLSVVTAGLFLAHQAPVLQTATSRLSERTNWAAVIFVLEHVVFLLIGLQMASIVEGVEVSELTMTQTLVAAFAVLITCLVLRPLWILPLTGILQKRTSEANRMRNGMVTSWAGMRGVVTLAAALSLPGETPYRASLVMIALVVTVGTLVLQGLTLPALARALGVRGPDAREDALQEATVLQTATAAGLAAVDEQPGADPMLVSIIHGQATWRVNRVWERLGTPAAGETPSEAYRRLRLVMLAAERETVMGMRRGTDIDNQLLADVLAQLDAEEATLEYLDTKEDAIAQAELHTPTQVVGACDHLTTEPTLAVPLTPEGCEECLAEGLTWVHLRLCTHCGHVGCCDSSVGKHAAGHYVQTDHPVMRSFEPGEHWRWCYVDEVLG